MTAENSGERKIRNIDTGNQQNKSDGPQQNQQRRTYVADQVRVERQNYCAPALIVSGILLFEAARNCVHLSLRLLDVHAGPQAPDYQIIVVTANDSVLVRPSERCPHLPNVG